MDSDCVAPGYQVLESWMLCLFMSVFRFVYPMSNGTSMYLVA